MSVARSVARIVRSHRTVEGGGFPVRRPFPTAELDSMDPFLLLDEMGPVDWPPGGAIGAPDHPHRGFETVTYLLEGKMVHRDSKGHTGVLGPGDVQWMTAGAGVVHSEMPEEGFQRGGGKMHGFQLWVNLPRRLKMAPPRYQDVPSAQIPLVRSQDGTTVVRIVAGDSMGTSAVIDTHTPIVFLHFTIAPGARAVQPLRASMSAFAWIFGGSGTFGREEMPAIAGEAVFFAREAGDAVFSASAKGPLDLLLLAGEPLNEPVARWGPFVMNTQQEVLQAFEDYEAGRLGLIG